MKVKAPNVRRYRGVRPDERRARRKAELILAGIAVYGERGYRHSTVKAVCDAAGLTERYFYESFVNSEALLAACYETITKRFMEGLLKAGAEGAGKRASRAERMRTMLHAYFTTLRREPRSAQVFLTEIRGIGPVVDAAFESSLREFGRHIRETMAPDAGERLVILEAGVVGGVMHIALRWIAEGYRPSVAKVTAAALLLCQVFARKS
jgi:AcrR family transcriptional regulator